MHLTPAILVAAYEYMLTTLPFRRWKMPHSDDVVFRIVNRPDVLGYADKINGKHVIGISSRCVSHTNTLMHGMAHEMVHVHLDRHGVRTIHGKAFHAAAKLVCRQHGFDPKVF